MGEVEQLNVYKLNKNNVYDEIQNFLKLAHYSLNTKDVYERGIRDFFSVIRKKQIEHLTWEDVQIKKKDIEMFRTILKEHGNTNTTINNKVAGLRRLYYELASNEHDVNIEFFKAIKKLPDDTNSYDAFTLSEVEELVQYASREKFQGKMKANLIMFGVDTCIRMDALLNLKWSDFELMDNEEVKINAIDKGNKYFRAKIHYKFYQELLECKSNDTYVFDINKNTLKSLIPRIVDKLENTQGRNLTFHSLRKTGITFKYRYTGDIKVAQKAANHADPSLTFKTYINDVDYGVLGYYSLQEEQDDILNTLTRSQLLQLINSLDTDLMIRLCNKAQDLFKDKK